MCYSINEVNVGGKSRIVILILILRSCIIAVDDIAEDVRSFGEAIRFATAMHNYTNLNILAQYPSFLANRIVHNHQYLKAIPVKKYFQFKTIGILFTDV